MIIRYSKKLESEVYKMTPEEKLEKLVYFYINGMSLDHCSWTFTCDKDLIISALKYKDVFEHKICSKCKILKSFDEFYMNESMGKETNRSGVSCQCRECVSKNGKNYFKNNRDHKRKYDKEYKRQPHVLEQRLEYQKKYFKDPINLKKSAQRANKIYHSDIKKRLHTIVSVYINKCLFGGKKGISINKILGYTMDDLKIHLEKQFDNNMTWINYGFYWEIDHIIPVSNFTFISYEDEAFKKCWSLENLQPLEKTINRIKSNKLNFVVI